MKVLLSIKPEFVEKIFDRVKKFEYRKSIFKNKEIDTIVIYATKPVGKIVGEIYIEQIIEKSPKELWELTKEFSGIDENFYESYFADREKAYAIAIKDVYKYKNPICPYSEYENFVPPQSFRYWSS
jgi:predicted transcriptional regulator